MELVRRLSALVIALSLALPQRSCVSGGTTEIHFPLSNFDSALSVVVIAALYSLPLIVLLFFRLRKTSLVVGILSVAAGLYLISYAASVVADKLLVGWYTYTISAIVYFYASLTLLKRALSPKAPRIVDTPPEEVK